MISATNVNLLRCVKKNNFARTFTIGWLYFRLSCRLCVKEEKTSFPWRSIFLGALSGQSCVPGKRISLSAASVLAQHLWTGECS